MNKEVAKSIKNYHAMLKSIKQSVVDFIANIEEIPAQRIGHGNVSAFTVSIGTVMSNGGILSPFYYDVKSQKEFLINLIKNSRNLEFMSTLEEIANTGKHVVRNKGNSYQQHYAPTVVAAIKEFIKEENDA